MKIIYSKHALEEINRRVIPKDIVDTIIKKPQQVILQNGFEILQSKVQLENKMFVIRVITKKQQDNIKIITVYKTTKIKKYWRNNES